MHLLHLDMNKSTCLLCGGRAEPDDPMLRLPSSFRTPHPDGGAYHRSCYFNWAIPMWSGWLSKVVGITQKAVGIYSRVPRLILDAREDRDIDLLDPAIGLAEAKKKDRHFYSIASVTKSLTPAWSGPLGFVTWVTEAPSVPSVMREPPDRHTFGALTGFWQQHLLNHTRLQETTVKAYARTATESLSNLGWFRAPFPEDLRALEDHPKFNLYRTVWNGPNGFLTWYKSVLQIISWGWDPADLRCASRADPSRSRISSRP